MHTCVSAHVQVEEVEDSDLAVGDGIISIQNSYLDCISDFMSKWNTAQIMCRGHCKSLCTEDPSAKACRAKAKPQSADQRAKQ